MKLKGPRPFQKCLRPTPVPSNLQPREKVTAYLLDKERDREDRERSQEYSEGEHLNSEASESFINIKHKDSVISSEHQNLFNEVNNSCSKAFLEHKKIIPRSRSSSLEIHSHHDHHCRVDLLKSALHKDHIFSNNEKMTLSSHHPYKYKLSGSLRAVLGSRLKSPGVRVARAAVVCTAWEWTGVSSVRTGVSSERTCVSSVRTCVSSERTCVSSVWTCVSSERTGVSSVRVLRVIAVYRA
uniref:(California timema) hypothetical protein n=1 Tax=Timema californicum TaxID=61474 RepID=A0A7R9P952_TIMCA|nr:unnamed protein product [Timema californicum]